MARVSNVLPPTGARAPALEAQIAELGQLLSRMQHTVLHPTAERERKLRTSDYERARVSANLEFARSLLTKLEREAQGIKAPTKRFDLQSVLDQQREALEQLLDRLEDLKHIAIEDDDDSSDGEDLLGDVIPTPSESMDSTSADPHEANAAAEVSPDPQESKSIPEPTPATTEATPEPPSRPQAPTQTTQTMRSRTSAPSPTPSTSGYTTSRAALFANRQKAAPPHTSTATTEAILDHQRQEQDTLSNSILNMASALKASSQKFSTALEADKEVVGRAGDGMEKTERSMDAARGRMGMLRKMTEGKGWWARMILYAWIFGLMISLVLFVFVFPKLRF